MEISNSSMLVSQSSTSGANNTANNAEKDIREPASSKAEQIQLSSDAKAFQTIDETSDKIDKLLMKNMSSSDKESINQAYQRLDALFDKENPSVEDEKKAKRLMDDIDKKFNTTLDKLPKSEQKEVNKLADEIEAIESKLGIGSDSDTYDKREMMSASLNGVDSGVKESSAVEANSAKKKALTTAQLNALSAAELRKLPMNQLKKLNAGQLKKLSSAQLNSLELPQLERLSAASQARLNDVQAAKLA